MSRSIVHLSDIHFGRVDVSMLDPLVSAVTEVKPDVVVVSGDLTQRARTEEFLEARAFLDRLPAPRIVVPGNHDVPLYNLYGRFIEQLGRYQRYITEDLEPAYIDNEIAVVGTNTARSFTWKGGRINFRQIACIKEKLADLDHRVVRIVVTHHPFDLPHGFKESHLVGGARMAMAHLAECGADLLLAGHMHTGVVCRTVQRYQIAGHSALVIQAGTAVSTRRRGERNSFNYLQVAPDGVRVERWCWQTETRSFAPAEQEQYRKGPDGWESAN